MKQYFDPFFILIQTKLAWYSKLIPPHIFSPDRSKSSDSIQPPIYIDPMTHTTPDGDGGWFFDSIGGESRYFKYNDYSSCVDAYQKCPPVAAIINRKAQTMINGKTWILNSQGKEVKTGDAKKIKELLDNPNPIQSGKQFEAQLYIFMKLFGFAIVLPIKPFGMSDPIYTKSLWNIPVSWVDWNETEETFNRNGGKSLDWIFISFRGHRTAFRTSELLIIRDFTPSFDTLTFPASPINALAMPINNIIGAYESRNVLINYRGALGILSSDAGKGQYVPTPLTNEQKKDLQNDFRKYGLKNRQWKIIMTSAALKWQQMGYATKDLMLMEEVTESALSICDGLNYPPHLLGLIDPTYNNQKEAEKGLYQNATIPDAENIYGHWNKYFQTEERNLKIDKDFAHIPALQADKESESRSRYLRNQALQIEFQNNLITLNRWRQLNDEDTVPGDDLYYYQLQERYTQLANPSASTEDEKQFLIDLLVNKNLNGNGKQEKQLERFRKISRD